jgi:hypothetical protein
MSRLPDTLQLATATIEDIDAANDLSESFDKTSTT